MTVKTLRQMLAEYPDDTDVVLNIIDSKWLRGDGSAAWYLDNVSTGWLPSGMLALEAKGMPMMYGEIIEPEDGPSSD